MPGVSPLEQEISFDNDRYTATFNRDRRAITFRWENGRWGQYGTVNYFQK